MKVMLVIFDVDLNTSVLYMSITVESALLTCSKCPHVLGECKIYTSKKRSFSLLTDTHRRNSLKSTRFSWVTVSDLKLFLWGWRDGATAKSPGYSSRGP